MLVGFLIQVPESRFTGSLEWRHVVNRMATFPKYLHPSESMDLLYDKGLEIKVVNGIEVAEHLTLKLKGILNCLGTFQCKHKILE